MGMSYNSYFLVGEEGTQNGTEANIWGVESDMFNTGMYFDSETLGPVLEQRFLTEIGRTGTQDRAVKRHRILGRKCEGSVTMKVYPEGGGDKAGIGMLLKHAFGDVVNGTYSGPTDFLHTYTPRDDMFTNLGAGAGTATGAGTGHVFGLTVNIGREDTPGTIRNYPFLGCRIRSIAFNCAVGEELATTVEFVGRVAKANAASKSVSFPTMEPFTFADGSFQIGVDEAGAGGTVRYPEAFSLTVANNFREVWTLGTNVLGRCVPNGQRTVTGSYTAPFDQWVRTEYEKWVAGTSSSCEIAFTSGSYKLVIRLPKIFYTGTPPSIDSLEENVMDMSFQAVLNTNFDVRILLVNTDAVPGFSILAV